MNTSGLFIFLTGPEIWLKAVHLLGPGGKKTEGIKVAAVERTRVNDGVDFFPREAQGNCFRLATKAREIDMRASPYDLTSFGYDPIKVETPEGRRLYEKLQRHLADEAQPLRESLILHLTKTLNAD